eukprot:11792692-Karenia_brevis.AAC.1
MTEAWCLQRPSADHHIVHLYIKGATHPRPWQSHGSHHFQIEVIAIVNIIITIIIAIVNIISWTQA